MGLVKTFQHDDPLQLRAVEIPEGDLRFQAIAIIEEFLMMGASGPDLVKMFNDPFYSGLTYLTRRLGEQTIRKLVDESVERTPSVRVHVTEHS
ncbi:MAG: hypothetical protein ACE5GH_04910 [Fidelibacterota bacterium]